MTRWTVFDSRTGEQVSVQAGRNDEVVHNPSSSDDALSSATSSAPAVAVLPARAAGSAAVITIRSSSNLHFEPTGFLGVHDQVVLENAPPPRKKWWQKLLG